MCIYIHIYIYTHTFSVCTYKPEVPFKGSLGLVLAANKGEYGLRGLGISFTVARFLWLPLLSA